jgi:dihydrofolate reductase
MRRLTVFNQVSLDGYYCDAHGDMSWAHRDDAEFREFTHQNARGGGVLVFGRVTYEQMAGFWPSAAAQKIDAETARAMNSLEKIVFSKTLSKASWNNTTLYAGDLVGQLRKLKHQAGLDLVIMGSGSLIPPLLDAGLIDELQLVVNPLALGSGRSLFAGVKKPVSLERTSSRNFKNGNVLLCYAPA